MTTYITQEQAVAIFKSAGVRRIPTRNLNDPDGHGFMWAIAKEVIQAYRDSLVAGVVLPEPAYPAGSEGMLGEDCYTADQLRQAIANDRAKQLDHLQDIAAFIAVGGYNGATAEQLVERIKNEFQRITDDRAKQVPKCVCGEFTLGVVHRNDGPCYSPTEPHVAIAAISAAPSPKEAL